PFGLGGSVAYVGYLRSEQHGAGHLCCCQWLSAVNGLLLLLLDLVPRFGLACLWCCLAEVLACLSLSRLSDGTTSIYVNSLLSFVLVVWVRSCFLRVSDFCSWVRCEGAGQLHIQWDGLVSGLRSLLSPFSWSAVWQLAPLQLSSIGFSFYWAVAYSVEWAGFWPVESLVTIFMECGLAASSSATFFDWFQLLLVWGEEMWFLHRWKAPNLARSLGFSSCISIKTWWIWYSLRVPQNCSASRVPSYDLMVCLVLSPCS
ncbi:hypothetical protein U1Q18_026501, partial [Sarracenia purpurea var. burkii]